MSQSPPSDPVLRKRWLAQRCWGALESLDDVGHVLTRLAAEGHTLPVTCDLTPLRAFLRDSARRLAVES